MQHNIIIVQNIEKIFDKGLPNEVRAIKNLSFNIPQGEVTIIRGPSGSGKTTLLSLIGCMTKPTSGEIFVLGERITKWSELFLTFFRRKHIGFVFQNFNLISQLTAYHNIALPLIPTEFSQSEIEERIKYWCEKLDLLDRLHHKVNVLSGGEMQRVVFARALVSNPEILLADEPTAHLDTKLSLEIIEIFRNLRKLGKTIVIATHDPIIYNSDIVTKIIDIRDGQITNLTE